MTRLTLRNIRAHKRRLVGTALAIVLGVAFLSATLVMGDTMRDSFSGLYDEMTAGTDVVVRNETVMGSEDLEQRGPVPAEMLDRLASIEGVAAAAPGIEGSVQILDRQGDPIGGDGPPVLADNWVEDEILNPMVIREGRAPEGPGEVAIDRDSARKADLTVGDTTTVRTPAPLELELVGTYTLGDNDALNGATSVSFETDVAAELMTEPGQLSTVRLRAESGVSSELLRDRVAAELDPGFEALTGTELADEYQADTEKAFLNILNTALLVFAGIALLVASFSIHNTFSIIVAQRSRESALLRALGASRGQVLFATALEALVVGLAGSAIGLAAGVGLAVGLKALLASAGMELVTSGVVVQPPALAAGMVVGLVVTVVSAVVPSLKASRVAPLAALRELAVDQGSVSRSRTLGGITMTLTGFALVVTGALVDGGSASLAGLGAAVLVIGTVVLGPVVARPVTAAIGSPLAVAGGTTGRIARRNVARNPRRTAGSATALLVGVAVVALMATFASSLKTSMDQVVDRTFRGDLVLDSGWSGVGMSPELTRQIGELDEVDTSFGLALAALTIDGRDEMPLAADTEALGEVADLGVIEGSVDELQPGQLAISETYAGSHDLAMGSKVTADFADGAQQELTVSAVYSERDLMGDLVMLRDDWIPHAGRTPTDLVVLVGLADGVSIDEGRAAVQALSDVHAGPTVQDRDEYLDTMAADLDQLLYLVYGLLGLAVLIALMGIANTLSLGIHERTRELGLLRAVGQSRRQLRSTVRWESVITAVFGTVGGIGLGTFLGWGLVKAALSSQGFGAVTVPTATLVVVTVMAAVAGVLAAVRPARRAARLDILEAVATS